MVSFHEIKMDEELLQGHLEPDMTNELVIIRENDWIREYGWSLGSYIDSKYRSGDCTKSSKEYVQRWLSAKGGEKDDMEIAFEFFPDEPVGQVQEVIEAIGVIDPEGADKLKKIRQKSDAPLTAVQEQFLIALVAFHSRRSTPSLLVGDNDWFCVRFGPGGYQISSKILSNCDVPTKEDLELLYTRADNQHYRKAIRMIQDNIFLINPRGK